MSGDLPLAVAVDARESLHGADPGVAPLQRYLSSWVPRLKLQLQSWGMNEMASLHICVKCEPPCSPAYTSPTAPPPPRITRPARVPGACLLSLSF